MTSPQVERPKLELGDISAYLVVVAMVAAMWLLELIDLIPGIDLDRWGIRPRTVSGLVGIPLAPFLHAGLGHLIANTIAFLVLGFLIAASGTQRIIQVTVIVTIVAGLGVWLTGGAGSVHLGASGVVFGYLTYLVTRGFFQRHAGLIVMGILVFLVYGGILWGLLPRPGISWQGHLFGAIGGIVAAWLIHGRRAAPPSPPSTA